MARKALSNAPSAAPFVPARPSLPKLREAATHCRGCDLYRRATQTVFGAGATHAQVMLVGEQPGNEEDLRGEPFVGPAGKLLDRALDEAGIDRKRVYVTNAVKHFKWKAAGKRRLHEKPNAREVAACRPWLSAEIDVVKPHVVVCLGATAAQAILGRDFKVTQRRGELIGSTAWAQIVMATVHPSSILRAPDDETRHREFQRLVDELAALKRALPGASW